MAESDEINIKISEDVVMVLFEFFERFEEKERLYFVHPAEYLALMRLAGRLEYPISKILTANSNKSYEEIVFGARERIAEGFESDFPVIEKE